MRRKGAHRSVPESAAALPLRAIESAVLALLALAVLYYALFIHRTSFVINNTRYYSLFDDAMISMRYARNLVQGMGLVFNPGDRPVEGFSNPLWVLVMAAAHFLPLPPQHVSLVIQLLGAGILVAILIFARRLAGLMTGANTLSILGGMAMVAFYYPLVNWTLQGLEVGLLALIGTAATWMLFRPRPSLRSGYLLLGLGTLVRLDAVTLLAVLSGVAALTEPERRAAHLKWGLITAGAFLAAQTLARVLYFGDLLPNTYYLKMTGYPVGLRVARGAWVLLVYLGRAWGLPLMLAGIAWALARRRVREGATPVLLAALVVFLTQCAYSAWVGGDAWEYTTYANRYVTIAIPLVLVAGAWSLVRLADVVARGRTGLATTLGGAMLLIAAPGPAPIQFQTLALPPPYVDVNRKFVIKALASRKVTTPEGTVAVAAAGAAGYFSDRHIIDLLGKCDRHVARAKNHIPPGSDPNTAFVPGHQKWDATYSFGELQPDVVLHTWAYEPDARPYLEKDYVIALVEYADTTVTMAVRKTSRRVLRDSITWIAEPKNPQWHVRWLF